MKKIEQIASLIDSTNLMLDATEAEICALCDEAADFGFAAVCVYPTDIAICSSILYNTAVNVSTVIGFPHGRSGVQSKRAEILEARDHGAAEVDIVLTYNHLRRDEKSLAADEAALLCEAARSVGLITKIVVEAGYLKKKQKRHALAICEQVSADFIQTSTGFDLHASDPEDVALFCKHRSSKIAIKAIAKMSAGSDTTKLFQAGASRLGHSKAGKFMKEVRKAANA